MQEADILHQTGNHWVTTARAAGLNFSGYAVLRDVGTHSVIVARIGHIGHKGLQHAIKEVERRETKKVSS